MPERKFLVDINFDQNELQFAVIHTYAAEPAAGIDGQLYYNTSDQLTYQYKAGGVNAWVVIGGSGTTNLSFIQDNAAYLTVVSSSGSNTNLPCATESFAGVMCASDKVDLEALKINAIVWQDDDLLIGGPAGTTQALWFLDEDDFASNDDTKVASQQSIKKYVDDALTGGVTYKGGYNASTDVPTLETNPSGVVPDGVQTGDMYTVTTGGTGIFYGEDLEIGDVLIAESLNPVTLAGWTIVQKNETNVVSGPTSAVDSNVVFFDGTTGRLIKDSGLTISGSNTGDEVCATEIIAGLVEKATQGEVDAGTDTGDSGCPLFVAPSTLQTAILSRYTEVIGNAAATTFLITHTLGNIDVQVVLYDDTTDKQVECEVELLTLNTLNLNFNAAPGVDEFRAVIIG